jgi:hypothetical protein
MSNLWVTPEELGEFAETEFGYEAAKAASYLLWALSGRKYSGTTTVTEKYVCSTRAYGIGGSVRTYTAGLVAGSIANVPISRAEMFMDLASDGLPSTSRIRLRNRPVTKIHAVRTQDGEIVDPSTYYLANHSTVYATSTSPWTSCNVEVTYSYGSEPPTMGKIAARTLAMEFAKLWNGDDDCILPQRITSINRQGVAYTLLDDQTFIDDMRVGIYTIDLFLKSTNPDRARARSKVFSPDTPRGRRITPKPLQYVPSVLDITVTQSGPGSISVALTDIDASFLLGPDWEPEVVIRNIASTRSKTLESAQVEISDPTPAAVQLTRKSIIDDVAVMRTATPHGLFIGTEVVISGVDLTFDGTHTVTNVLNETTFTFDIDHGDVSETVTTGTVVSSTDNRLQITVSYTDARSVLGMYDPGTYDIYGVRTVDGETETVFIVSANLKISMASNAITAYTIGS